MIFRSRHWRLTYNGNQCLISGVGPVIICHQDQFQTLGHKPVDLNLKPPANDDRKSLKGRRFYARLSFSSRQLPGRERGEEGERIGEAAVNVGD